MRRLLPFLFLSLIFSCSTKKEKVEVVPQNSVGFQFDYSLDTVIMDSGDSMPYLDMNLVSSDYDAAEGLFYNLDPGTARVDVYDIAEQKLIKHIQFDVHGPNGIRKYFPTGIKKIRNGDFIIRDYFEILRMGEDTQLKDSYRLQSHKLEGDDLGESQEVNGMGEIAEDGSYFASYYGYYPSNGRIVGLAKVDLTTKSLQLIPVNFRDQSEKFLIRWEYREGKSTVVPEYKFITLDGRNFIATNSYKNELWYYYAANDSVVHRVYKSSLISNIKRGYFRKQVGSMQEFNLAKKRKFQEVVFGPIIKDPKNKRFYRYSREVQAEPEEGGRYFRFVLSIFDENLNLIHEEKLDLSAFIPGEYFVNKTFVHEGMLYTFLKLENQIAFVRLQPRFENE
ncbi:DUF4221 domain-containing protein [Algoriphagus machipongonensis]|uniref:Lipoprotein n=1 Tax=Algoriphagus machipongonensis TaxID=388413 RepID=A3HUC4_9BACT|nr:DUF4221 domain-containing protein [Algoriphagus machipongonensis]EAZ81746.1 hypothetical protein ALPR1_00855 [Algoriphagus machipongonensis]